MQATQPVRTFQPAVAGLAGFLAAALFIAAIVLASVLPSIGNAGAGTDTRSGAGPALKLDPDARDGGAGIHPGIPR